MARGFKREELQERYDVSEIIEDAWHAHCGVKTSKFLAKHLGNPPARTQLLLNAGAGVYSLSQQGWHEVALDLFLAPLAARQHAVCASVEHLPFRNQSFGAIVAVGEVLSYCDPARAIWEFARVLAPGGLGIFDFTSSRCFRYWFRESYGRAADLVTDQYNGRPERTWIYDPAYIRNLLNSAGFKVKAKLGTHAWSALAQRAGLSTAASIVIERWLGPLYLPSHWAYLMTIVAERGAAGT